MGIVLVWWLWMEVAGLAALPLAYRFFGRLSDRGYAFARPLGLLLSSYVLWLGASLGLLRNSLGGILFGLALVALGSLVYYRRRPRSDPGLAAWLRANWRTVLTVEVLFAGTLAIWSLIRAYSPEITTAGGEKFMEIMYLNSIGRSDAFPPHDAWLSGYAISYYYFGYVMVAMLTRLSGMAAHLTFNVGLASLFAMTCTGAFGVVYNLVRWAEESRGGGMRAGGQTAATPGAARPGRDSLKPIAFGLLAAVLVAVLGNLEGFLEVLYSLRIPSIGFWRWLDIQEINQPFNLGLARTIMPGRSGWWWWRASRVINDLDPLGQPMGIEPIDEFPGFSFLLGDMHPHVLALPFVLLALAVALRSLRGEGEHQLALERWWGPLKRLSLLAPLCLGALGFLNTWDFPVYLVVFLGAYAMGVWRSYGRWSWLFVRDVVLTGLGTGAVGILFYLPFYLGFQSQAGGILPALYVGTRFRQYFVMFGPFLVAIFGFLILRVNQIRREEPLRRTLVGWARWTAAFLLTGLTLMLLVALMMVVTPGGQQALEEIRSIPFIYAIVGDRPWVQVLGQLLLVKLRTWVMPLVVAGMAGLGAVLLLHSLRSPLLHPSPPPGGEQGIEEEGEGQLSSRFALLCAVVGLLLTLAVEFVYLVDVFRVRMNTVFKFYFQAWVLMAIAATFAVYWLHRQKGWLRGILLGGFWTLFVLGMVFPVLGNISRAGGFRHRPTLDGTAYVAVEHPEDYAAIEWLNQHVDDAPVILEAPGTGGSSYVYEGRISALTGLPTLLGWPGHENQWRGDYTIQSAREADIQTIYNTHDAQKALDLLKQYGVKYVYVGPLERGRYDSRGLAKFEQVLDVVYQNTGVAIYRVK